MGDHIELGELVVEVTFKQIKNIHLSVHPPSGRVTVSAPNHMRIDVLRAYVISKLDWIRNQRKKILQQDRETEREFINRETHFVWGRRYLLSIIEKEEPPKIEISYNQFILQVRPQTSAEKRELLVDRWYREQVRQEAAPLIKNWETILNVKAETVFVRRMKTRWGSCQPVAKKSYSTPTSPRNPSSALSTSSFTN